jgi:nucleoside-diphosphate-sugar epimerase
MPNNTVLVTGGPGFIGSDVVELFLQKGMSVPVLDSQGGNK